MSANKHPLVIELLHDKVLRSNLIGCIIIWSMCAFNFYLLTFFMKYFPGNIFENSLSFAISDVIAFTLSGLVIKRTTVVFGYKIAFLISTTGGILYMLFSSVEAAIPILICISRMGVVMAFNMGYISVPKLFPTKFQSTVYAVVNFFSHLIACAAPLFAEIPAPVPYVAFIAAIVISVLSLRFLTEMEVHNSDTNKEEQDYYEVQETSGISQHET